jgi:hypothetical protein
MGYMRGSSEIPKAWNLFSSYCNVSTGAFSPFIQKEEARGVVVPCHNPLGVNIVTCKNPHLNEFLTEVKSLDLDINLTSDVDKLPAYIPILDYGTRNIDLPFPVVGLTFWDIISKGVKLQAGCFHEESEIRFKEKILESAGFANKKTLLFLTGADTLIEWLWYNRAECKLFYTLKQMGFWAAGGFNFSVIGGECPFSHALNFKKSLLSSKLIEGAGLLAIPHVYAISRFHIERWIYWFRANPSVRVFTINCQLQKKLSDIEQVVIVVKSILNNVPNLHVILQGFRLHLIEEFGECIERIHLADKKPVKYAQNKRKILFDIKRNLLADEYNPNVSVNQLVEYNVLSRCAYFENIRKRAQAGFYKRAS